MSTLQNGYNSPSEDAHRLAVETDDRSVVVSAGAGSGKTQVLAERFVRLVTTGKAQVDEILTITYTRKAAREMKERIVHLLEHQGIADASWLVESAYISTIDSLCARLIRENPFESAVDPFFEQLSEHDAQRQFYRAFDRVVDRHSTQSDSAIGKLLREAFGRMRFGSDPRDALHTLRQDLYAGMETVRLFGWEREKLLEWADEIEQRPENVVWQVLELIRKTLTPGVKVALQVLAEDASLAGELRRLLLALDGLRLDGDPLESVRFLRQALLLRQGDSHVHHPVLAECLTRVQEWLHVLNQEQLQNEIEGAWRTVAALRLMVEAWDEYQHIKAESNRCDFADVMSEAIRLLRQHSTVRKRYHRKLKYVLVDEFQDANHLQMTLIKLLSNRRNLFVVGDVKQSIYAFRHADVSLFRQMERSAKRFPENAQLVHILRNFRSRPEILRFVDAVFGAVWSPSLGGDRYHPLQSTRQFAPKEHPSVEFVLVPPTMGDEYWAAAAQATARHIQQMVQEAKVCITAPGPEQGQPLRYRHIAILLRQTNQVSLFEEALSRAGVPFYNTARRRYYVQPEVRDLIFALTAFDSPANDVALAAVLRSPMVGVSMDTLYACASEAQKMGKRTPLWVGVKRWLEGAPTGEDADAVREFIALIEWLQTRQPSLDVAQVLATLIHETRYETRLLCRPDGKQRVANVRKLLQIATENRQMSVPEFVEMANDLERIAIREGEAPVLEEVADVVRIYTVHGAKGLQFHVVYLPDVARRLYRKTQTKLVSCIPSQRFIAQGFVQDAVLPTAASIWSEQREREEGLRVWYVAMTRAIEHLVFVAPNAAGRLWWNLFLDALQLPHTFAQDTVVQVNEHCAVQVNVTSEAADVTWHQTQEAQFEQLAQWLQASAECSIEDLMEWLSS